MAKKILFMVLISLTLGILSFLAGFSLRQSFIISIFLVSILGTLFFWDFRLSFVFIGSGLLLLIHAIDLENFMKFASLDVIIFLIGMMIVVGMMKDAGFFHWLVTMFLRLKKLSGRKFFILLMLVSALLSGLMGEISSIIVMMAVILEICSFLEVDPLPMVISSVLATNIGSASTVLGNPIGILIAARSKLSFENFITFALPVSILALGLTIFILCIIYRSYLKEISLKLETHQENKNFLYLISIPPDFRTKVSMLIFGVMVLLIALHRRMEILFQLGENSMLIMLPVIFAGIVMIYRHDKARYYVEHEVEWNSLLFFMFLFAQAGVVQASGVGNILAKKILGIIGNHPKILLGSILFSSGLLSGVLDNVVVVASYVPIVKSLHMFSSNLKPVWWAILFGACFGGNITMIGSTANIVALGILEKKLNVKIAFSQWLKVGLLVGFLSMLVSYFMIIAFFRSI
ncbi:MAG TPA: SLC13 family permease [bacterium]|nr:SLC13 family permease [bacterium]